jgi:hypothetical protein
MNMNRYAAQLACTAIALATNLPLTHSLAFAQSPTTAPTNAPTTQSDAPSDVQSRLAQLNRNRAPIEIAPAPPSSAGKSEITGGGRNNSDLPQPVLFAEHQGTGVTISPNPTLCFYIAAATKCRVVVTLSDSEEQKTLGRETFESGFAKPGVYYVQMRTLKQPLKPGHVYTWTLGIKSPDGRSDNDAVAVTAVRYRPDEALSEKIANLEPEDRARVLGAAGVWYDSIAALCEAIDKNPADPFLRAERTRLLTERKRENAAAFEEAR